MKLGIACNIPHHSPEKWASLQKEEGLSAVVFPLNHDAPTQKIDAYVQAAKEADLTIAEVGAWSNPLSPDAKAGAEALANCIHQMELADYVGAACCVNISGAVGAVWDGAYAENYSAATYAALVGYVQKILDTVKPKRSFYSLEPMPNMLPDSPESYAQLIKDIDRPQFAVHLDLVNMLNCPRTFVHHRDLIDRFFALLGPYIKSCHLKDAVLDQKLTVSIREELCGKGEVDLAYYFKKTDECNPDLPMIIEHLPDYESYMKALRNVKQIYKIQNRSNILSK